MSVGESRSTDDWVSEGVAAALAEYKVPEGVAKLLQDELRGKMSERALRPNDLSALASDLLAAMTSADEGQANLCG